ncbi:MAG: hypothetical protein ACSHXK_06220 [Oceanococcus sp.]
MSISTRLAHFSIILNCVCVSVVLLQPQRAFAQDDLGMRVTGDDDANFGLTISNWVNGQEAGTLAPGLIGEDILPLDEWEMRMQITVERAASAPGAPINRP